ncbi:MAG: DinB family protein [Candidatus Hydrogenedentota bacterium]
MRGKVIVLFACVSFLSIVSIANAAGAPATSPAKVDAWDIKADFAKLNQQFDAVAEVLNSEKYFNVKNEKVSKWSCGDQAGHIVLAAQMMRGGLQANIDNPELNVDGQPNEQGKAVMAGGDFPRGVAQAPEAIRPEGKTRDEFIKLLASEKKAWNDLEKMSDKLVALKSRSPHPAFGPLSCSDWVRFVAIHSAHHLALVRDILKESANTEFGKNLAEAK